MGLFSRLFGNGDAGPEGPEPVAEPAQPDARPAAGIAYDAKLIATLKHGHGELLRICSAIQTATSEHRFNDIEHLLAHLKQTFQLQVTTENTRFYAYVNQRVAHDKEAAARLAEARREMAEAGFELLKVADAYIAYPPTYLTETRFKYEFDAAAALLRQRVEKAENQLYPLYLP